MMVIVCSFTVNILLFHLIHVIYSVILVIFIFSDVDAMVMSTVSALAEARHTSYIRGRWIYTDNGGEHQYQIIEPTLPGNGDYSPYIICCQY